MPRRRLRVRPREGDRLFGEERRQLAAALILGIDAGLFEQRLAQVGILREASLLKMEQGIGAVRVARRQDAATGPRRLLPTHGPLEQRHAQAVDGETPRNREPHDAAAHDDAIR